jgi:hypothetical protein
VSITKTEMKSARHAADLLRDPKALAPWLASLGAERPAYIAALKGHPPASMHPLDRLFYPELGRLLGPSILKTLE